MPANSIKAVTFDVGGTLIEPWPSVGHVYAEAAARHSVKELCIEDLNRRFGVAWRTRRDFGYTRTDWAALVDETFADLCNPLPSQSFFDELYQRFAEPDAWRIHEDVLPTLEALAGRRLALGIVSNWDERLRPLLGRLGLDRFFQTIVISVEAGCRKPDTAIFRRAAKQLGLPTGSILHVGDSLTEDVDGADAAGMRSVLLARNGKVPAASAIVSLAELCD